MFQDYILNSQGHGAVAQRVSEMRFDMGLMRPYIDGKGRQCVTMNAGNDGNGKPMYVKKTIPQLQQMGLTANAASLRKDEWVMLDNVVIQAARKRLRAWADLMQAASFGGFNAMGKTILEHETMSDPGEAFVDMDATTEGRNDIPEFQLEGIPLPITHSDFTFSARKLATSRNGNTPIDTTMAEVASRRVAEKIEKTLIGVETGIAAGQNTRYGRTSQVYGYTNFPDRITKTDLTAPTAGGWSADDTINEVIDMRELCYAAKYYGPFMLYHSPDWDKYLDRDYILTGGNVATQTLRQRLENIDGIQGVRRLDYLTDTFTLILVQMTEDVARAIDGMGITLVQWESRGGLQLNFKVMAIQVPQLRADYYGNTGLVHATTA